MSSPSPESLHRGPSTPRGLRPRYAQDERTFWRNAAARRPLPRGGEPKAISVPLEREHAARRPPSPRELRVLAHHGAVPLDPDLPRDGPAAVGTRGGEERLYRRGERRERRPDGAPATAGAPFHRERLATHVAERDLAAAGANAPVRIHHGDDERACAVERDRHVRERRARDRDAPSARRELERGGASERLADLRGGARYRAGEDERTQGYGADTL